MSKLKAKPIPPRMTIAEIQRRLARIVRDLDEVSGAFIDRGLKEDWYRLLAAETELGKVCMGFLDDHQLDNLDSISDVMRPGVAEIEQPAVQ
jgi:hypothetical protein